MKYDIIKVCYGQIIDDDVVDLSIFQLGNKCKINPEREGESKREWRFPFSSIDRVLKVKRLQNDLEINLAGVTLVFQLLDDLEKAEAQLKKTRFHGFTTLA